MGCIIIAEKDDMHCWKYFHKHIIAKCTSYRIFSTVPHAISYYQTNVNQIDT